MLERLSRLAKVPNAPTLYSPLRKAIENEINLLDAPDELRIACDEFALYIQLSRGQPQNEIFLIAHLDHPGIVLKDGSSGVLLGTVGYKRLQQLVKAEPTPICVFDPDGKFQQKAEVTAVYESAPFHLDHGRLPMVAIKTEGEVKPNSHGLWNLPSIEVRGGKIYMRSADDIVPIAIALEVLQRALIQPQTFKNINLTLIFTHVEEIHQICATAIANRKVTPFGPIGKNAVVLALEAMESQVPQGYPNFFKELTYNGGVLVKVNDMEGGELIPFGQGFSDMPNLAEILLLQAVDKVQCSFQHAISAGSTDAKSFSLENITPSVAALAIPTRYKHNWGKNGEIVLEEIWQKDMVSTIRILTQTLLLTQKRIQPFHPQALLPRLRQANLGMACEARIGVVNKRRRIMRSYLSRLRRARFFPENPLEHASFSLDRLFAACTTFNGVCTKDPATR